MKVPLDHQLAEVRREIALRRNVYPQFVARGKLTQAEADEHLNRMQGVEATIAFVHKYRDAFVAFLKTTENDLE